MAAKKPLKLNVGKLKEFDATDTIAIVNGGTGAGTATLGFNALSPLSTLGDLLVHNGTNNARLGGQITVVKQFLSQTGNGSISALPVWATITAGDIGSGAALTRTNDTNVTLTLGGAPTVALLAATSLTLGWTGTLAPGRGGTGIANNAASTLTITGAYATTITLTNTTSVTLPVSGTLVSSVTTGNGVSAINTAGALAFTLGVIAPTSVNGLTITTTTGTFTLTAAKTLSVTNTLTLSGTDSSTLNIGTGGTLGTAAYTASTAYQPVNTNLTSLSGLTYVSTSFVKMTAAGTFGLDTNTYLTGNQSITLSGEASGSGTTSISVTLANSAVIGKVLTGYTSGAGVVSAADTILSAIQKLNGNIGATGVNAWNILGNAGTTAGTNFIGTTDAIDLVVKTTNAERMRILAGGNVGIGTATPTLAKLQIEGTGNTQMLRVSNLATTGTNYGIFGYSYGVGGDENIGTIAYAAGATVNKSLVVSSPVAAAGTYTIYAQGLAQNYFAGSVGIGTTAPASLLEVQKNQDAATYSRVRNDNNHTAAAASSIVEYGNLTQFGNFLQCSPLYATDGLLVGSSTNLYSFGSTAGLRLFTYDATNLTLGTTKLARMTILSGGNVGIGTAAPLSKLSINGGLHVGGDSDAGDNNVIIDGTITISGGVPGAGKVLTSNISGLASWETPSVGTVTGVLPIANGGTNSSTQNWVDLTTVQTANGAKTWGGLGTFSAGITSSGAAANINVSSNFATNINTGTSTGTVTIGGTGIMAISIGAGGTGAKIISIGDGASTGSTTIESGTGVLNIGVSNAARIISIGTATAATAQTVNINNTATAGIVNIGAGMTTGTINIGGTGLQTGTITMGGGTGAQIINLGTGGTGVKTINLGTGAIGNIISIGSLTAAASLALRVGTGNFSITGVAGSTYTIGTGTTTGSISIGAPLTTGTITLGGTSMTGSTTINSGVVTGTGATSALVLNTNSLTSGTGMHIVSTSVTNGNLLDIATSGNTYTGSSSTGLVNISSSSTGATGTSYMLSILRTGAVGTSATPHGIYCEVGTTGTTNTKNIAGFFTAAGAAAGKNYAIMTQNGKVVFGNSTSAENAKLCIHNGHFQSTQS